MAHDLLDGVHVSLDDGVFQARCLADIFAGVDIDCHQRLSLIDHDVATALQPHFRLQRFVNFFIQAKLVVQRCVFGVKLDAFHQGWLKTIREAKNALIFLLVVHPDGGKI